MFPPVTAVCSDTSMRYVPTAEALLDSLEPMEEKQCGTLNKTSGIRIPVAKVLACNPRTYLKINKYATHNIICDTSCIDTVTVKLKSM